MMNGTARRRLPTIHLHSVTNSGHVQQASPSISEKFRNIGQQLQLASSQGVAYSSTSREHVVSRSTNDEVASSARHPERIETLQSSRSTDESQLRSVQFARTHPTNSANLRECAKSIRENVTHFKDQLMRNEFDYSKQLRKTETLSSLVYLRSSTDDDRYGTENGSAIEQTSSQSSLVPSREVLQWKKALDQSERQREQLTEEFEALIKQYQEKDRLEKKSAVELKDLTEQCDTYERQNGKLQQDLRLALEKLEEMSEEAERFALEAQDSQKQLADCEQKYDEFQIQTQENIKQWTAKVKKMEKDLERQKSDSTEMLEKNNQLTKERDTLQSANLTLRERITELEIGENQLTTDHQEHSQHYETEIGQLRSVRTHQAAEIDKLRAILQQMEHDASQSRQRSFQLDREKQSVEQSHQDEVQHRQHLHSKVQQTEKRRSQLEEELRQLEVEHQKLRDQYESLFQQLAEEKLKSSTWETTSEQIKKQLERAEQEAERQISAVHLDYGEQMDKLQSQISTRFAALQQHDLEYAQTREELLRLQTRMDSVIKDLQEKSQVLEELELKNNRTTSELTEERTRNEKKEREYQHLCDILVHDLNSCAEGLSSNALESLSVPNVDHLELWLNQVKMHFSWLKQEIDAQRQRETLVRRELDNLFFDSETDRKYFAAELAKREVLINDLTDRQHAERNDLFHRLKFFSTQFIDIADRSQTSIEPEETDCLDLGFRQFQTMIDSVRRDLQTAKVQLSA